MPMLYVNRHVYFVPFRLWKPIGIVRRLERTYRIYEEASDSLHSTDK